MTSLFVFAVCTKRGLELTWRRMSWKICGVESERKITACKIVSLAIAIAIGMSLFRDVMFIICAMLISCYVLY
jgi:hypothetical protein